MRLTDPDKREAITFIEAGTPLPDRYRLLLFDDMRIEQIDEPRKTTPDGQDIFGNDTMKIMEVTV